MPDCCGSYDIIGCSIISSSRNTNEKVAQQEQPQPHYDSDGYTTIQNTRTIKKAFREYLQHVMLMHLQRRRGGGTHGAGAPGGQATTTSSDNTLFHHPCAPLISNHTNTNNTIAIAITSTAAGQKGASAIPSLNTMVQKLIRRQKWSVDKFLLNKAERCCCRIKNLTQSSTRKSVTTTTTTLMTDDA
jgi:hypothetical protein